LVIAAAIGSVFTILAGLLVGTMVPWLTSSRPKVTAEATAIEMRLLPIGRDIVPSEFAIKEIQKALSEWRNSNNGPPWVSINTDSYDLLRLLSDAGCAIHLEIKNGPYVKATNLAVLIPDAITYFWEGSTRANSVDGNKISIGDLLPSESRAVPHDDVCQAEL
jgi:hypothetical protein